MEKQNLISLNHENGRAGTLGSSYHDETDSVDYIVEGAIKPKTGRNRAWSILAKVALIPAAIAIFYLGRITHETAPTRLPDPVSLGRCPPDWREAKARGCVYDFILSTWIHPRCFNEEMHERYLGYIQWRNTTFWYEQERINEVPFDVAAKGEHDEIYTDGTIHHMHCSYVWDRITYASHFKPKVLDSLCRDPTHVEHCILYNAFPQSWELDMPSITRVFNEPFEIDCLVG
ncbi:hypothetical protein CCHL11_02353 [Colletotrichum chlorophyti]|uniref:Uncharacterized protein n=1 Tax=Colletotrichum chlorophyti TaxID=708187 RepID=A0A1Q8S644_9PEZI|nr:hypothetical protein CCHL11_02353 [Colletotrichum chlorophyti]